MIGPAITFLRKNWYLLSAALAVLMVAQFVVIRMDQAEKKRIAMSQPVSLDRMIIAAERLANRNELARAIEKYLEAIRVHSPKADHLHLRIAKLYQQIGTTGRAIPQIDKYLALNDLNPEETAKGLELKGDLLVSLNKWDLAAEAYQSIETAYPAYRRLHDTTYKRGEILYRSGNEADAEAVLAPLKDSIDISLPNRAKARFLLAALAHHRGDSTTAMAYTELIEKKDVQEEMVYYTALILAGQVHAASGQYAQASRAYKAAATFLPEQSRTTAAWLQTIGFATPPAELAQLTPAQAFGRHFAGAQGVVDYYVAEHLFQDALELHRALGELLAPVDIGLAQQADIYEHWVAATGELVEELKRLLQNETNPNAIQQRTEELQQRQAEWITLAADAGDRFSQAATLSESVRLDASPLLLKAAAHYRTAELYAHEADVLHRFVNANQNNHQAVAKPMLQLGEAYLKLGQPEQAIEQFNPLIHDPGFDRNEFVAYNARTNMALAFKQQGKLAEAITEYEFFYTHQVDPAALPRIRATLGLAKLHHALAKVQATVDSEQLVKAITKAEEFIARYAKVRTVSEDEQNIDIREMTHEARYILAMSRFDSGSLLFSDRDYSRAGEQFQLAEEQFRLVARDSNQLKLRKQSDLFAAESILRQAEIDGEAVDPALWESALTRFRSVANTYMRTKEAVYAMHQAAVCLRQLGRTAEAGHEVEKAKRALDMLKKENTELQGGYLEELLSAYTGSGDPTDNRQPREGVSQP